MELPFDTSFLDKFQVTEGYGFALNRGELPLHHLLMATQRFVRADEIYVSSFSLGEESVRSLAWIREMFPDSKIYLLLDFGCKANKLQHVLHATSYVTEIRFTANHSKLVFLTGSSLGPVMIHSSANLQSKDRLEAHLVVFDAKVVNEAFNSFLVEYGRAREIFTV